MRRQCLLLAVLIAHSGCLASASRVRAADDREAPEAVVPRAAPPAPAPLPFTDPPSTTRLSAGRGTRPAQNVLEVPYPIVFQSYGATLDLDESLDAVQHVAGYLHDNPHVTLLRIEVHSDNGGNEAANQRLTEERARAIAELLVNAAVECERLLPVGFGSRVPLHDNSTPEGRAANRRVHFVIAGEGPANGGGTVAGNPCR